MWTTRLRQRPAGRNCRSRPADWKRGRTPDCRPRLQTSDCITDCIARLRRPGVAPVRPCGTTTTPSKPGPTCAPITAPTSDTSRRRPAGSAPAAAPRSRRPAPPPRGGARPGPTGRPPARLHRQLDQALRGTRRGAHLLQRHDPALRHVQQRLHPERGAQQRGRRTDPAAAAQPVERVHREEHPAARAPPPLRPLHGSCGQARRGGVGRGQHRVPQTHPGRPGVDHPDPVRTDLVGRHPCRLPRSGQLPGQMHRDHAVGPGVQRRAGSTRRTRRAPAGRSARRGAGRPARRTARPRRCRRPRGRSARPAGPPAAPPGAPRAATPAGRYAVESVTTATGTTHPMRAHGARRRGDPVRHVPVPTLKPTSRHRG